MVLPPFIVKGGFLLASILFRVLDGPQTTDAGNCAGEWPMGVALPHLRLIKDPKK